VNTQQLVSDARLLGWEQFLTFVKLVTELSFFFSCHHKKVNHCLWYIAEVWFLDGAGSCGWRKGVIVIAIDLGS